jgi:hypothetical protein
VKSQARLQSSLKGKARIAVTAVYANGVTMLNEQEYLGDVAVKKPIPDSATSVIELRVAVPSKCAEELQEALRRGDVELLIENIPNPTDRSV